MLFVIVLDEEYKNSEEYLQFWRANKQSHKEDVDYNDMMRHDL